MTKALLIGLAVAAAAGCAQAKPSAGFDKAAAQAAESRFADFGNAGNAAGIAQLYTADAVILPPGAPRTEGRAAIQAYWAAAVKGVTDVKLTAVDVKTLGPDAAQETGTFAMKTRATPAQAVSGKYVVIWRRVGGEWKLATDIWTPDR